MGSSSEPEGTLSTPFVKGTGQGDARPANEGIAEAGGPPSHGNSQYSHPAFIGRAPELAVLRWCLERASNAQGSVVLIAGEAGIGKTRLSQEIADAAEQRGLHVFWGRCWEGEGAPAFWPWIQVMRDCQCAAASKPAEGGQDGVQRILDGLFLSGEESTSTAQSRFRLFDSVFGELRSAAEERPLLIILDDLHWADPASLMLLQFVAAELKAARVIIVGTYRDVDPPEPHLTRFLANAGRHGWITRIPLVGLSDPEVAHFIRNATGSTPSERTTRLLAQHTGGNPFFLIETMHLSRDNESYSGSLEISNRRLPDTVCAAVGQRLKALPVRSVRILAIASIIGDQFDLELLASLAKQPSWRVRDALEPAYRAKLVKPTVRDGLPIRFTHALVRQFLYEQMPVRKRDRWHAKVARLLESLPNDDLPFSAIALHYSMAGAVADRTKAFEYSLIAGDRAFTTFAYEDAVDHYSRALTCGGLIGVGGVQRCKLLLSLGEAQTRSGQREQARQTFRQATELAKRASDATLLARAAIGFAAFVARAPVDQEAVGLLRGALSVLGSETPTLRIQLLGALIFALHFDPEPATRTSLSGEALELAQHVGHPSVLAEALEARLHSVVGRCGADDLEKMATDTMRLSQQCNDQTRILRCRLVRYMTQLQRGLIKESELEFYSCSTLATELRDPRYLWQVAAISAGRSLARGNFEDADRRAGEAERIGRGFDSTVAKQYRILHQMLILYCRGEIQYAESGLRELVERHPDFALSHAALANACSAIGKIAEARHALESLDLSEIPAVPGAFLHFVLALAAEAVSRVGDEVRCRVLYQLLLPYARENVLMSWGAGLVGPVSHYLGVMATCLEEYTEAERHFSQAISMHGALRTTVLAASTERAFAEMLLRRGSSGDEEHASEYLRRAVTIYEAFGLQLPLEATSELLRRLKDSPEPRIAMLGGDPSVEAELLVSPSGAGVVSPGAHARGAYVFRREGDFWTIVFEGRILRLVDTNGLNLISFLLQQPETEMHVLDLIDALHGRPPIVRREQARAEVGRRGGRVGKDDSGPLVDARARQEYRNRVAEIRVELAEAEGFNDVIRASELRLELERVAAELGRVYGGGRGPRLGTTDAERARVNVRNHIATALRSFRRNDEQLWRHFRASICTGTVCCYRPERPLFWEF